MAKTNFYLDARGIKPGESATISLVVTNKRTKALISTGVKVLPEQFDGTMVTGRRDAPTLTSILVAKRNLLESVISQLTLTGELRDMTASEIKNRYFIASDEEDRIKTGKPAKKTFERKYIEFMEARTSAKTRIVYRSTLNKMRMYDKDFSSRTFEDIDKHWLQGFDAWQPERNKRNSKNLDLRNIRAVFNDAIDDELTTAYPFRKIKIKPQATKDRSLTADELRTIFNYPVAEWQKEYVDMFKLIFLLEGINIGDLADLTDIYSGRIEYDRKKTRKHYSIKVEPEALSIINKYKGESRLLNIKDRYKSHSDYNKHLNNALKSIGLIYKKGKKPEGKAIFPDLSTYYARYSWASIAAELDIPRETIAAALGHTVMDVTAIYIRTDMKKKIDAANRKVIDYVLYGKTSETTSSSGTR